MNYRWNFNGSRNIHCIFISGWIISDNSIFGGNLVELFRFVGMQYVFWKEISYKMRISVLRILINFNSS